MQEVANVNIESGKTIYTSAEGTVVVNDGLPDVVSQTGPAS